MLLSKNMTLNKDSVSLKPSKKKNPIILCVTFTHLKQSNLRLFVFHFSNSKHGAFNQIKFGMNWNWPFKG